MKSLENQGFSFFLSYDMIESVTVQRQRNRLEKQRKSGVEKMSRVIVVTDSNSGITQSEAKELGVVVMPMPFYINGQMFYEDIDLTQEQFYQKLKEGGEIKTSMPFSHIFSLLVLSPTRIFVMSHAYISALSISPRFTASMMGWSRL